MYAFLCGSSGSGWGNGLVLAGRGAKKRLRIGLATCGALAACAGPATAGTMVEYANIPVIVNLYDGSNVTQEQVNEAIKFSNEVYKSANIKFTLVKTNPNVANPGNGDSTWSSAERSQARADGRKEINDFSFFNNEGIKVSYAGQPDENKPNTNGLSVLRNPVTIVKGSTETRPTAQVAETTAHEIGHVLGLDDVFEDADSHRLMYGYRADRTDHQFTEEEKITLMHEARIRGVVQKKMVGSTPSTSVSTIRGSGIVDFGAVGAQPGPETAVAASLTNAIDPNIMNLRIDMGGVIPKDHPFTTAFFVGYDTDNNSSTGENIGPAMGVDRHVFVDLFGSGDGSLFVFSGLFIKPGERIPGAADSVFIVDAPEIFNDGDLTPPTVPTFPPSNTVIDIPIQLVALDLTSVEPIQVTVSSGNPDFPTSSFSFELTPNAQDAGPHLSSSMGEFNPSGAPGTLLRGDPVMSGAPTIDIIGSHFDAFDMIDLFLDDDLLMSVQADDMGNINEMVMLPGGLPENDFFFITGQSQSTGDFAFFVVESVPEPATAVLLGVVGPLLTYARRQRRL